MTYPASSAALSLITILLSLTAGNLHALPFPDRTPGNKLTASDAADDDEFGYAVAQSGDLVVVGAHFEDGAGTNRGAAYVYHAGTGSEIFKLTADDAGDNDRFGLTVAVSNRLCIVGAPEEDGAGTNRGAAYVFDLLTGEQLFKLTATDAADGDQFGYCVAISGKRAIIGAWRAEETGLPSGADRGAAYVFDLTTGTEITKLIASDAGDADYFGTSVAIHGNTALVGAYREDGPGMNRGAAYLFEIDTATEIAKLTASDAGDEEFFGRSVALNDRTILVGAHRDSGAGSNRGAVYVFDFDSLEERFKLTASDAADNDEFGFAASLSGDLALVGAHLEAGTGGTHRGKAYAFDVTTGEELATFTASDSDDFDRFAISVSLEGNRAFVGAFREDGTGSSRGAAYGFIVPNVRPDNLIGTAPGSSGTGNDIYNASGAAQTLAMTSTRLAPVQAWLTITADGNVSDDYRVSGGGGNGDFRVTYTRYHSTRRTNVTAAMIAGTHVETNLDSVESGRLIKADITPSAQLKRKVKKGKRKRIVYLRKSYTTALTTTSETWETRSDTVKLSVGTR